MKSTPIYLVAITLLLSLSAQAVDKQQMKSELQKILQKFEQFDENKDKQLCQEELKKVIPQEKLKMFKKALKKIDADQSRSISAQELKAVLK